MACAIHPRPTSTRPSSSTRRGASCSSEDDTKSDEYANNLYYVLLYARRFAELRETLREAAPGVAQRTLLITALAAEHGGAAAIEASRSLVSSEADRRTALASAGNILTRLREYPAAADLIEASTRGQTTTAANTQRIAMLRKTTRIDGRTIVPTDPRGVVLHALGELFAPDRDRAAIRGLLSQPQRGLRGHHGFQPRPTQHHLRAHAPGVADRSERGPAVQQRARERGR